MCDLLWSDPDDRFCKFLKYLLSVVCSGSRAFIPDPVSFSTRIPDRIQQQKNKRVEKTSCVPFFVAINLKKNNF
jgi:hypothetical protein